MAALRLPAAPALRHAARRALAQRADDPAAIFRTGNLAPPAPPADRATLTKARLASARIALERQKTPRDLRLPPRPPAYETEQDLHRHVESLIQESMRSGQFDNLKNKGRPLPHQPTSARDYLLRNMHASGLRPAWLQLMHDIDVEKRAFRAALARAWHRTGGASRAWARVARAAEARVVSVNAAVDTFNLTRPHCVAHLFRLRLRLDEELRRAMESPPPDAAPPPVQPPSTRERGAEPRPAWQLYARFVRAAEVPEYDSPAWGRRRPPANRPSVGDPRSGSRVGRG